MLKDRVKNWMKKQSNSLFHTSYAIFHFNNRNTILYTVCKITFSLYILPISLSISTSLKMVFTFQFVKKTIEIRLIGKPIGCVPKSLFCSFDGFIPLYVDREVLSINHKTYST